MSNFEKASRLKLRFETNKGSVSTEELWDLSLNDLDTIFKRVNSQLRAEGEESLMPTSIVGKNTNHNALKVDILRHVYTTKVAEQDARKVKSEDRAKLERIKELVAAKQDAKFAEQSLEELTKQLAELEAKVI